MGIIPAYAGNTKDYREHAPHVWDHPRVCGEHHMTSIMVHLNWGSSPRMRGTRCVQLRPCRQPGIIPAYAGNTMRCSARYYDSRDHPRVCGEHSVLLCFFEFGLGSSPRMRGTPSPPGRRVSGLGIIPAYAGNTPQAETSSARSRDHPRVCGEHCRGVPADLLGRGSSPRMRGTRIVSVSRPDKPGIIPAYAGNTVRLMRDRPNGRDHPRVCGEHLIAVW